MNKTAIEIIREARKAMRMNEGYSFDQISPDDDTTEGLLKEVELEIASYTEKKEQLERQVKETVEGIKKLNNRKRSLEMKLADEKREAEKHSKKTQGSQTTNEFTGKDYGSRRQDWEYKDEMDDMIDYLRQTHNTKINYVSKYQEGKATQGPRNWVKANIKRLMTAANAKSRSVTLWTD